MSGPFEWDEDKAERNLRLHGVAFTEAVKVFDDTRAIEEYDVNIAAKTTRDTLESASAVHVFYSWSLACARREQG